jgi:sulfate permease
MNEIGFIIPLIVGAFLAVNMGASGTAPAFSAAFGSRVIRKKYIPILFTIFVFAGAFIAGQKVSATIGKEIIPPELLTISVTTIILLAVSLTLLSCNLLKIPQSTSHTTVFSIAGAALFFQQLESDKLFFEIIPTWFILPIASFFICFGFGKWDKSREKENVEGSKSGMVKFLIFASACYVSFSIGANNIGNIAGPLSSMAVNYPVFSDEIDSVFLFSALCFLIVPYFGFGSAVLGKDLVKTTGKKLILIREKEAIVISVVTATLLLLASVTKGIPASLVQLNTGAIFGLGIARYGWRKIFFDNTTRMIWLIWLIAPLFSFILTIFLLLISRGINIL